VRQDALVAVSFMVQTQRALRDPDGREGTVRIFRTGVDDPALRMIMGPWFYLSMVWRRVPYWLRRRTDWTVRLHPGHEAYAGAWERPVLDEACADKVAAAGRAEEVAAQVEREGWPR